MSYIKKPKKLKDFENNVNFQLDNIEGWISIKDYENALIKAKCLIEDLEILISNKVQ